MGHVAFASRDMHSPKPNAASFRLLFEQVLLARISKPSADYSGEIAVWRFCSMGSDQRRSVCWAGVNMTKRVAVSHFFPWKTSQPRGKRARSTPVLFVGFHRKPSASQTEMVVYIETRELLGKVPKGTNRGLIVWRARAV